LRRSGTGGRRASGWRRSRDSAVGAVDRAGGIDGAQPGALCRPAAVFLCGGRDCHVCHAAASAAGRSGRGHAGGAGPGTGFPLWGDTGSRTFTAQLFAQAPIPEPHTAVTLPAMGICQALVDGPGSAGGILCAAAGHEPGDAAGAGGTDCGGDSGQIWAGDTGRGQRGDLSGGDGAAAAGSGADAIGPANHPREQENRFFNRQELGHLAWIAPIWPEPFARGYFQNKSRRFARYAAPFRIGPKTVNGYYLFYYLIFTNGYTPSHRGLEDGDANQSNVVLDNRSS
jgi:hypothetical protein